ncbi:MAG: hypothetical protein AAGF47_05450 [Planctomycetota bacterium]
MRRATHTARALAAAASAWLSAAAPADPPPIVDAVLSDLSRVTGELIDYDRSGVTLAGRDGEVVTIEAGDLLALIAEPPASAGSPARTMSSVLARPGLVTLVDGQRLSGSPSIFDRDDGSLVWDHTVLGTVELPLDRIDRVRIPRSIIGPAQPAALPPAATDDVLLLTNGDRLEGFLTRAGSSIGFEVGGNAVEIDLNSVDQYAVANPPEPMTGTVAWLTDGSIIAVPGLTVRGGLASFDRRRAASSEANVTEPQPSEDRVLLDEDSLAGLVVDAGRLRPLGSLSGSEAVFRPDARAEPLGSAVRLDGPGLRSYRLPEGAEWFAAEAVLPLRSRVWGEATLRVLADGTELAAIELGPESWSVPIRVPVRGAQELTIVLEPGRYGDVQVTAELHDAVVAVDAR